jgi:hypothetical protein
VYPFVASFLSWFCAEICTYWLRLKLTGGFCCVGVLQLDPTFDKGGLKHGVFIRDCVGVWSGDIVGVLSGLITFVGVTLPFLFLSVF